MDVAAIVEPCLMILREMSEICAPLTNVTVVIHVSRQISILLKMLQNILNQGEIIGRMHMDDNKFGEEDDGRDLSIKEIRSHKYMGSYTDMSWLSEVLRIRRRVRNQIL